MAYQAGMAKLQQNDYVRAVVWFEKAEDYGDAREQILAIGEYYYNSAFDYEKAESVYIRVRNVGNAAQRLYEIAQYYELVGDSEKAEQVYREAGEYADAAQKAEALYQERNYQAAEELFAAGDWKAAKENYENSGGYKDSAEKLQECEDRIAEAAEAAREARELAFRTVGAYVTFGSYEQDNNSRNGQEAIEWLVLEVQGNKALLISRYGLDAQPYNKEHTSVTWETSTLRSWLNGTFLNAAFTTEEQAAILTTNVDNSKSQGYSPYGTNGGNNTQDKLFLLSYAEANKYFGVKHFRESGAENNTTSRVSPTAYAKAQGAWTIDWDQTAEGAASGWWLRSSGLFQSHAAYVDSDGSLSSGPVDSSFRCVRPAFWINLDSEIF